MGARALRSCAITDDRRAVKRNPVLRCAEIIVPRRSPVIHCTVQNITSAGACLKLANTSGIPPTFELTFEHGRPRCACRVVWRTETKLGVTFEPQDPSFGRLGRRLIIYRRA